MQWKKSTRWSQGPVNCLIFCTSAGNPLLFDVKVAGGDFEAMAARRWSGLLLKKITGSVENSFPRIIDMSLSPESRGMSTSMTMTSGSSR